jgi:hypothetical protein
MCFGWQANPGGYACLPAAEDRIQGLMTSEYIEERNREYY